MDKPIREDNEPQYLLWYLLVILEPSNIYTAYSYTNVATNYTYLVELISGNPPGSIVEVLHLQLLELYLYSGEEKKLLISILSKNHDSNSEQCPKRLVPGSRRREKCKQIPST